MNKRRAGSRAGGRGSGKTTTTPTRGRPRKTKQSSEERDVFQDMLEEVGATSQASATEDGHATKRRRVAGRLVVTEDNPATGGRSYDEKATETSDPRVDETSAVEEAPLSPQIVYRDTESETESDESDEEEWENVNISSDNLEGKNGQGRAAGDLNLVFEAKSGKATTSSRRHKAHTADDRKLYQHVHKANIVSLLAAIDQRNRWCNDAEVQKSLRPLLSQKTTNMLKEDPRRSLFYRNSTLLDGLGKAVEAFQNTFRITAKGLSRCFWDADREKSFEILRSKLSENEEGPIEKETFRQLAKECRGSRDVGAQLFCAMLRSLGLEVRLVCSLQVLPLSGSSKAPTPQKPQPPLIVAHEETRQNINEDESASEAREELPNRSALPDPQNYSSPAAIPKIKGVQRFGRAGYNYKPPPPPKVQKPPPSKPKTTKIKESKFPVFWVEVFNRETQKWIPVDPLVTKTVSEVTKFEPPAADQENQMAYCIAFEDYDYVRDVTSRYAKAPAAKTRRLRVESIKGHGKWLEWTMRYFIDRAPLKRDGHETEYLLKRELAERQPDNIQDYKYHPYFALERHLHRDEVIYPKKSSSQISAGVGKPLENIYPRKNVHQVKSHGGWYRLGRIVKNEEVDNPLKILAPRKRSRKHRGFSTDADAEDSMNDEYDREGGNAMYAYFQTEQYDPGAVDEGFVPRNKFDKIDVYVPSMIPAGAAHIRHPKAQEAAKKIDVDHKVPATGFKWTGRRGQVIFEGVIVAAEYCEAIVEWIKADRYRLEEEYTEETTNKALMGWRQFFRKLQIQRRIRIEAGLYPSGMENKSRESSVSDESEEEKENFNEGGFLLDQYAAAEPDLLKSSNVSIRQDGAEKDKMPLARDLVRARQPIHITWGKPLPPTKQPAQQVARDLPMRDEPGGFLFEDDEGLAADYASGGFLPDADTEGAMDYGGGGFLPEDELGGGSFVLEPEEYVQEGFSIQSEQPPSNGAEEPNLAGPELNTNTQPQSLGRDGLIMTSNFQDGGILAVAPHNETAEIERVAENDNDTSNRADYTGSSPNTEPSAQHDKVIDQASNHTETAGQENEGGKRAEEAQKENEDDWDKGSLLSEDPEDEDTVPEWMY